MYTCFIVLFICVQNIVYVMLAALQQFEFCCLLRLVIISSLHEAFSLSTSERVQALKLKNFY